MTYANIYQENVLKNNQATVRTSAVFLHPLFGEDLYIPRYLQNYPRKESYQKKSGKDSNFCIPPSISNL